MPDRPGPPRRLLRLLRTEPGRLRLTPAEPGRFRLGDRLWDRRRMRFVIFGAGAIGGVIGGRLFEHGHDVVLVARGEHARVLQRDGLRLESPDGRRHAGHPGRRGPRRAPPGR